MNDTYSVTTYVVIDDVLKAYVNGLSVSRVCWRLRVSASSLRRTNMLPNTPADDAFIRRYRHTIETANSRLEQMGLQRLHVCSLAGFLIKLNASLLALACACLN
jgi:hypothetical protein